MEYSTANLPSATSAEQVSTPSTNDPASVRLHDRGLREPQRPWTWKQMLTNQQLSYFDRTSTYMARRTKQLKAEQKYQPRQNGVDLTLPKPAPTTRNLTASRPAPHRSGVANHYQPVCHEICNFARHRVPHATACVATTSFGPNTTDTTYAKLLTKAEHITPA